MDKYTLTVGKIISAAEAHRYVDYVSVGITHIDPNGKHSVLSGFDIACYALNAVSGREHGSPIMPGQVFDFTVTLR